MASDLAEIFTPPFCGCISCKGEVFSVRGCMGKRGAGGLLLIAAGLLLLVFSLPVKFWTAVLGCALIAAGILLLKLD